jgi:hypothetical protein|tara:strand:- start:3498 stop:4235 length:738 start_codon:yes stop_codon:yes gene_type:complete
MGKAVAIPDEINDLLAQQASQEAAKEVDPSPSIISTKGKKFRIGDDQLGDEIEVVVGIAAYENTWYDRPYDPNNTSSPACFSLSMSEAEMEHHGDSPVPQHDGECNDCPLAQWDTGANGKGKACKNARRLVVLASDGTTSYGETQMAMLKAPPTSLKNWASYAKSVALRHKRPTSAVLTRVRFSDSSDYPLLEFDMVELLDDVDDIKDIMARAEEMEAFALRPYNTADFEPAGKKPAPKKRSKAS